MQSFYLSFTKVVNEATPPFYEMFYLSEIRNNSIDHHTSKRDCLTSYVSWVLVSYFDRYFSIEYPPTNDSLEMMVWGDVSIEFLCESEVIESSFLQEIQSR